MSFQNLNFTHQELSMLYYIHLLQYAFPQENQDDDQPVWVFLFLFPFIALGLHYAYLRFYKYRDDSIVFSPDLPYSKDHLLEAYICLAAELIRNDTRDAGEKVMFMNRYFRSYFPNDHHNFTESLNQAYKNPKDFTDVLKWLRFKLPKHKQRVQIIYFLTGLSFIDGSINRKELRLLDHFCQLIGVSAKEFSSILGMHQNYEQKSQSAKKAAPRAKSRLQQSAQILGVSEKATLDEVKKAYRKLVKLHHPDRFHNESEAQQRIAEERFLKIQKAYEIFETHLK